MLTPWIEQQPQDLYVLINTLSQPHLLPLFYQYAGDHAVPLFERAELVEHKQQGPWLLACSPLLQQHPELMAEFSAGGIFFTSGDDVNDISAHLQSLLLAIYEGEVVLFRYYDVRVLAPFLQSLIPMEQQNFLGPIHTMAMVHDNACISVSNPRVSSVNLARRGPWWRLTPAQLASQYQLKRHVYTLERQLWQQLHPLMCLQPDRSTIIESAIISATAQHMDEFDTPIWAAAQLGKGVNYPPDKIVQAMKLTQQEGLMLARWMETR